MTPQDTFTLKNGYQIPCLGYGTWLLPNDETGLSAIESALAAGYRHIDTAAYYKNEEAVGKALLNSGIPRKKLFVTSKLWNTDRGYENTKKAFHDSLQKLGLSYIDLYLIHWPAAAHQYNDWEDVNRSTWRALSELYQDGKIKAIGVSNFMPHHLAALMEAEITPMVNQIEFHPGKMQEKTLEFCQKNNILVEAWSPLGRGKVLQNETLVALSRKYNKTTAQLCIRWCLEQGVLPLPKSVTPSRIKENMDVFDFSIEQEDMDLIDALPFCGGSELHPDSITF